MMAECWRVAETAARIEGALAALGCAYISYSDGWPDEGRPAIKGGHGRVRGFT
jgi:hypothetical protein